MDELLQIEFLEESPYSLFQRLYLVEQAEDVEVLPYREIGGHVRVHGGEIDVSCSSRTGAPSAPCPGSRSYRPWVPGCQGPC